MLHNLGLNYLTNHPAFSQSFPGKELQANPLGFIDIGARGGTHEIIEPIAQLAAVLGFEPDQEECQRMLSKPEITDGWADFKLEPIALYDKNGKCTLQLLSAATNHSLLEPNEVITQRYNMVKWQKIGTYELEATTLDEVLFQKPSLQNCTFGEFIKIDTQGTEYEILKGSIKTLKERTVAIIAEVAFCELYKDQKLFSELEIFLRELGFSFYGFMPIHGRSQKYLDKRTNTTIERALYADAIFFKDPFDQKCKLSERQNFILFTCALLIGFYDFALEIAKKTWFTTSAPDEINRIEGLIKDISFTSTEDNIQAVRNLLKIIEQKPEDANVLIGNFVDRRRKNCDYDDVLNISPLPKTL